MTKPQRLVAYQTLSGRVRSVDLVKLDWWMTKILMPVSSSNNSVDLKRYKPHHIWLEFENDLVEFRFVFIETRALGSKKPSPIPKVGDIIDVYIAAEAYVPSFDISKLDTQHSIYWNTAYVLRRSPNGFCLNARLQDRMKWPHARTYFLITHEYEVSQILAGTNLNVEIIDDMCGVCWYVTDCSEYELTLLKIQMGERMSVYEIA